MYRIEMFYNDIWFTIGRFYEQEDVINTMIMYSYKYDCYSFNIYENLDNKPYLYKTIRSKDELKECVHMFDVIHDIEDLSCVELKRLILKGKKLC